LRAHSAHPKSCTEPGKPSVGGSISRLGLISRQSERPAWLQARDRPMGFAENDSPLIKDSPEFCGGLRAWRAATRASPVKVFTINQFLQYWMVVSRTPEACPVNTLVVTADARGALLYMCFPAGQKWVWDGGTGLGYDGAL
jgi:hypothetical protein